MFPLTTFALDDNIRLSKPIRYDVHSMALIQIASTIAQMSTFSMLLFILFTYSDLFLSTLFLIFDQFFFTFAVYHTYFK